jgi:O-antigen ligase
LDNYSRTNSTPKNLSSLVISFRKLGFGATVKGHLIGINPPVQTLFLIAFLLPFAPRLVSYAVCIFFITSLISGSIKDALKEVKENLILQSGFLFFLICLLSALFSHNKNYAFALVSTKLGLLIFPFLFSLIPSKEITSKIICTTALFFIAGSMWGLIECFAFGIYKYIYEVSFTVLDINSFGARHFLGSQFSRIMHPSYFTLYLDLCLLFLFFNADVQRWLGKKTVFVISGVFSLGIFLLASKAGIICTFLIYSYLAYDLIVTKRKWRQAGLLIMAFGLIFLTVLVSAPELGNRFTEMSSSLSERKSNTNSEKSSALRLLVWHASLELIEENLILGVGIEHTHDAQVNKYEQLGYAGAKKYELNSHNQFLQTAVMFGLVGLFILLIWLGSVIKNFFFTKNNVAILFILLVAFNLQVEAMLEAQTGVLFIAFWIYFFWASNKQKHALESE